MFNYALRLAIFIGIIILCLLIAVPSLLDLVHQFTQGGMG